MPTTDAAAPALVPLNQFPPVPALPYPGSEGDSSVLAALANGKASTASTTETGCVEPRALFLWLWFCLISQMDSDELGSHRLR